MIAGILSIGSEIVTGRTVDTNSSWLCKMLFQAGIPVKRVVACDDALDDIATSFSILLTECDIVISTGGLGPTFDDLTRKGLAMATGRECIEDPIALSQIEEFVSRRNKSLIASNRNQALLPAGSQVIRNSHGTAPGIQMSVNNCAVYCLPGVPDEMKQMFEEYVLPLYPQGNTVLVTSFHFCGVPESEIAAKLDSSAAGFDISRSINAGFGIITAWLWGEREDFVETSARIEADLRLEFGNALLGCGGDTLASVIGDLAIKHKVSIGTIESCTGGLVAALITDVPGSSRYFLGSVITYSNDIKTAIGVPPALIESGGAVSESVALEMARHGREWLGADFVVSITGIAGPSGETETKKVGTVWTAVAGPKGYKAFERTYGGTRKLNRMFFANFALNNLRCAILEQCR